MFTFLVKVEKTYFNIEKPDCTHTIYGTMPIEAENEQEAIGKVEKMMRHLPSASFQTLQTIDPRITWDDTRDEGTDWEYEDYTFDATGEAEISEDEAEAYRKHQEAVAYKDTKRCAD